MNTDSVLSAFDSLPPLQKIEALRNFSLELNNADSDRAIKIIHEAVELASDINDSLQYLMSLITMGDILYLQYNYEQAIETYDQALALEKSIPSDSLHATILESASLASAALGRIDETDKYLNRSVKIYDSLGLTNSKAYAYFYAGSHLHTAGMYDNSISYFEKALEIANETNNDKLSLDIYNSIGIIYYDLGSFEEALAYYLNSLEIAERINDVEGVAFALNNIGIVYYDWGNLEKALEYYQQSMEMDKRRGNDLGLAGSYNNIGIIYSDWKQNDLAIEFYNKAVDLYKKHKAYDDLANSLNNIGESYADLGQYDEAIQYLFESLELEKTYGNDHGLCQSYHAIAKLYFEQRKYTDAIEYCKRAKKIIDENQFISLDLVVNELMYKIYKATNNPEQALLYLEHWINLKDTIYSQQFHDKIADLELKHELNQKQKDRLLAENQKAEIVREMKRRRMYLIIIFSLMVIFGLLVIYDIRSKTRVNKKLATVNQELEKQRDKLTQTLEQLTKNELKYKNLVQNAPTGILYINSAGKILEVNPTMLNILGSPGEEETKKINCLEYPPLLHIGVVDDIKACIKNNAPLHKEYSYTTKWDKDIFLSVYMTPIAGSSNQVSTLIINAEDVTISRSAERMIQKSEEKYRMLVEYSLQAMMIIQGGTIIFANSKFEELIQYPLDDLINKGRKWLKLVIHPDDLRKSMKDVRDALQGKVDSSKNEYRIIRKDGKVRWIEALSSVVNYKDQRSVLIVAIDITDRKEAESFLIASGEKLKQANAMKDKFFSIVAHDLKNPFNAIMGFSNLLFEAYDSIDDSQRKTYIKNICQSSESTFKLLQNLLDWSRTQTGNIEYNPQEIDLNTIAVENITVMQSSAAAKKIKVNINIPSGLHAYADENMIKTVVRNLLSNAIKFTSRGGVVEISAIKQQNEIILAVTDNGIGVDPENLPRLFRIDDQYKSRGTDDEAGTGLGLILCKELVEKNKGRIWVESDPQKGSKFSFTLPVGK